MKKQTLILFISIFLITSISAGILITNINIIDKTQLDIKKIYPNAEVEKVETVTEIDYNKLYDSKSKQQKVQVDNGIIAKTTFKKDKLSLEQSREVYVIG